MISSIETYIIATQFSGFSTQKKKSLNWKSAYNYYLSTNTVLNGLINHKPTEWSKNTSRLLEMGSYHWYKAGE